MAPRSKNAFPPIRWQKTAKARIGHSKKDDPAKAEAVQNIRLKMAKGDSSASRAPLLERCPLCSVQLSQKKIKRHIKNSCPKRPQGLQETPNQRQQTIKGTEPSLTAEATKIVQHINAIAKCRITAAATVAALPSAAIADLARKSKAALEFVSFVWQEADQRNETLDPFAGHKM